MLLDHLLICRLNRFFKYLYKEQSFFFFFFSVGQEFPLPISVFTDENNSVSKLWGFQRAGKIRVTISTAAVTWLLCRQSMRAWGVINDSRMILVSPSGGSGARDARGKWLGWLGVRMQSGLSRKMWRALAMANSHNQGQWGLSGARKLLNWESMILVEHDWKWWGAAASNQFQVHDCCLRLTTGMWILAVCFLAPPL